MVLEEEEQGLGRQLPESAEVNDARPDTRTELGRRHGLWRLEVLDDDREYLRTQLRVPQNGPHQSWHDFFADEPRVKLRQYLAKTIQELNLGWLVLEFQVLEEANCLEQWVLKPAAADNGSEGASLLRARRE